MNVQGSRLNVLRREDERLGKTVMGMEVSWKRRIGRPKRR